MEIQAKLLDEKQLIAFHHTKAQLLFMAHGVQRDTQTVVAFLTMRAKSPDEDNWGNLRRFLKYLNRRKYLKLTISMQDLEILKWFMVMVHNVNWDCKGHTGAI